MTIIFGVITNLPFTLPYPIRGGKYDPVIVHPLDQIMECLMVDDYLSTQDNVKKALFFDIS